MNPDEIRIRPATVRDAEGLLAVYAPYVEKTAIAFEYLIPTPGEFRTRVKNTLIRYPYLAAVEGEHILGYAYTGTFNERAACDWSVEVSIYVAEDQAGRGIGRALYTSLEKISRAQNIQNLNACIAYPEKEDAHLTRKSVKFHTHMGYRMVGEFHRCGYKFGTWYNLVWMEKMLGTHPAPPEPFIPFRELDAEKYLSPI